MLALALTTYALIGFGAGILACRESKRMIDVKADGDLLFFSIALNATAFLVEFVAWPRMIGIALYRHTAGLLDPTPTSPQD